MTPKPFVPYAGPAGRPHGALSAKYRAARAQAPGDGTLEETGTMGSPGVCSDLRSEQVTAASLVKWSRAAKSTNLLWATAICKSKKARSELKAHIGSALVLLQKGVILNVWRGV